MVTFGLLRDTSHVLLDAEVSTERQAEIRKVIESVDDNRVVDLHLWRVGPKHLAAIISIVCHQPKQPDHYKAMLSSFSDLVHISVEVHCCQGEE